MRSKIHKYKGYLIEKCFTNSNGGGAYFEAKPEIFHELNKLRENRIKRPWHGQECLCEECTYTEEDHAFNKAIEDKCKSIILTRNVNTIKESTMKACKSIIDNRTSNHG